MKKKQNLSTGQGRPIFSAFQIYKHWLNKESWNRATQLPILMSYLERAVYNHQLIARLGQYMHPEFVHWGTTAKSVQCSRLCYETMETYGDTILKLAATLLAYD